MNPTGKVIDSYDSPDLVMYPALEAGTVALTSLKPPNLRMEGWCFLRGKGERQYKLR